MDTVELGPAEPIGFALSPCGRYLAIGVYGGLTGTGGLQIWELVGARCVNTLAPPGRFGWRHRARYIQWSADGTRIAAPYNGCVTGVWDPFGESAEPVADAFRWPATDPDDFAFAPDGERMFLPRADFGGEIVPLAHGSIDEDDDVPELEPPDIEFPPLADRETGHLERVFWSRDGCRIYGTTRWGTAFSRDLAADEAWLIRAGVSCGLPAEWSLDERLLAHQRRHGRLEICDALTGRPIAEGPRCPGLGLLSWGAGDRLAAVVPESNDENATPVVSIVDGATGRHRYDIETAAETTSWDAEDLTTWAWAPDGERAACLTTAGEVEIWSLGARPGRLRTLDVPGDTQGVFWGADDVIVAPGRSVLFFGRPG